MEHPLRSLQQGVTSGRSSAASHLPSSLRVIGSAAPYVGLALYLLTVVDGFSVPELSRRSDGEGHFNQLHKEEPAPSSG